MWGLVGGGDEIPLTARQLVNIEYRNQHDMEIDIKDGGLTNCPVPLIQFPPPFRPTFQPILDDFFT